MGMEEGFRKFRAPKLALSYQPSHHTPKTDLVRWDHTCDHKRLERPAAIPQADEELQRGRRREGGKGVGANVSTWQVSVWLGQFIVAAAYPS